MTARLTHRHGLVALLWLAALTACGVIWWQRQAGDHAAPRGPGEAPVYTANDRWTGKESARFPTQTPVEASGPPTMFRGDRHHRGRSPYAGPKASHVAWVFETKGEITGQAAVATDGTLYVGSHDRFLYALSPHGVVRWKRDLGDKIYATPLIGSEGNIYIGSDAGLFWSLTPDGVTRWRLAVDGEVDGGAAWSPSGTIHFAAGHRLWTVRPNGDVLWRFEARSKIYTSPAVDDAGTVYVGAQDDRLYAIGPEGRLRWSYRAKDDIDSSPVIGEDGTIYFGSDDGRVYALDPRGRARWSTDLEGYVRAPLALARDGSILAGVFGPRPRLVSLEPSQGEVVWYFPVTVADSSEVGIASGPLVDRAGNIYVGAHDDYLYCLSASGHLRWIHRARGNIDAAPTLTPEGLLIVGSEDRFLYAFRSPLAR